ncbi:MAG: class I adenylate-forming enzyme family protein [Thermodesulfobacteriota bacterium]
MDQDLTIPAAFDANAARHPEKTAVAYLGTIFTYARIKALTDAMAAGLAGLGVAEGQKVVLYLPNSVQWLVAWLGVQKAGAVAVPITPIYTSEDLAYVAGDTEAVAVVCQDRNYGYVTQAMAKSGLKRVVVSGMVDLLPAWKRFFGWLLDVVPSGRAAKAPHTTPLLRLLSQAHGQAPPAHGRQPDDVAEILYTGGTTRHPKGVPITHRMLLRAAYEQLGVSRSLFPPEENVLLGSAPMFHVLGQTCGLGTLITYGGTMVLQPRVNLDAMFDAVERYRVRTLIGVPALFRMILEHDRLDNYDLSSLSYCFSGGDVLPVEVGRRWQERFGRPIYIGYGATETVGGVCMTFPEDNMPVGAMGRKLPSKDIRVVDPASLAEMPLGKPGELLVHADPMVAAYWNKPDETAQSFVDIDGQRYYRTADVVARDEDDFLYFVDRTVDTIKHKGYRVSASEIEAVLQEHPAVIESCVVGVPDAKVGERIKAFVVLKKDVKGVTGYDLISFCKGRLIDYKIPQYIEFRDMLPKSKVGKLLRREIRSEEMSRVEQKKAARGAKPAA